MARAAKIRIAKMKESENVSVTALCALDPFDDESPEDKITCEEEKKTEAES